MSLFEVDEYPEGFQIHRNYLSKERQIAILAACRLVLKANPMFRPQFHGKGFVADYALENTNCGKFAWESNEKGFQYSTTDLYGDPLPPIPDEIMEVIKELAPTGYVPENCLINFYQDRTVDGKLKKSRLGLHQDRTEKDLTAPIISISIGQACVFQIGGLEKTDKVSDITLVSGDVVVMGGKSRNCFHAVKHLLPNSCPKELGMKSEARINITIRQVNPRFEYEPVELNPIAEVLDPTGIKKRNEFQVKYSAEVIKQLEIKMLPSYGLRTMHDGPPKALTPDEREIYAQYLESKGQPKGAAAFRNYVEPVEEKPKRRKKNDAKNNAQTPETAIETEI